MDPDQVRNELHAELVNAPVVQAGEIHGGLHIHAREDTSLGRAARELASAVRRQWTTEAEKRALRQPEPLRVRFGDSGDVREVATIFRQLERRQLVVLGAPGAGKTVAALLLTLELLEHPREGEPVPILLTAASWNPKKDHLDTWAARRLRDDYPALDKDTTEKLVADGLVMIVLDGLDEMPAELHAKALSRLNDAAGRRPLVVTCRSAEYHAAVARSGVVISGATAVELAPVSGNDVAAYLTEAATGDRWEPVTTALREESHGPVATALSSPLIAYLARTVYMAPHTDPADLLRFATDAEVEQYLLGAYLPAVFDQRPQPVDPYRRSNRPPRWAVGDARRWLRELVRHGDFQWWHLPSMMPRMAAGVMFGLLVFGLFGLFEVLVAGRLSGIGHAAGVVGCLAMWRRNPPIHPGKVAPRLLVGPYLPLTIEIAAVFGLYAVLAVIAEILVGLFFLLVMLWYGFLRRRLLGHRVPQLDLGSGVTLADDRRLFLLWSVLAVAGCAAFVPFWAAGSRVTAWALMICVCVCTAAAGRTAWMHYVLAKVWLVHQRKIPWRLMTFLDDARQRGVLRTNGSAYQLRHLRLRSQLDR